MATSFLGEGLVPERNLRVRRPPCTEPAAHHVLIACTQATPPIPLPEGTDAAVRTHVAHLTVEGR
jgi:hypothetical protein